MAAFNAGYATHRQAPFTRSGAVGSLRCERLTRCRRFRPSPCPTHYGGRLATMPSADFCPVTPSVAARRAARVTVGSGGDSSPFGLGLSSTPVGTRTARGTDLLRICNMNFQCTTAAFTLSLAPDGFRHLVLTHPGTEPSMRFLSVGSHLCARASSRHPLAGLPLPSASSYIAPKGHYRYSYRGLSPHQFMPMPGVPQPVAADGPLRGPPLNRSVRRDSGERFPCRQA